MTLTIIGSVAAARTAILGLGFGFASAYFWLKSSRVYKESKKPSNDCQVVRPTGIGIAVGPPPHQDGGAARVLAGYIGEFRRGGSK